MRLSQLSGWMGKLGLIGSVLVSCSFAEAKGIVRLSPALNTDLKEFQVAIVMAILLGVLSVILIMIGGILGEVLAIAARGIASFLGIRRTLPKRKQFANPSSTSTESRQYIP